MKTQLSKLLIFSLFVIALGSCKKDAEMPKGEIVNLKTNEATEITTISAVVSAKAKADCAERGVCWGKNPNPTIDDFQVANGSGKGEYTCTLTDLQPNQKYYYRAYAHDGRKDTYVYANDEKSFFTLTPPLTFTANGVSFKMIGVTGGTFTMGATAEQGSDASNNEKPTHSVTLSSYFMGETEVTQALWQAVMGSNPSYFSGSNLPVEQVSWNACQTFITKLNQQCAGQLNGRQFRLPTEAEWEYAARGGKKSQGYKYSGSNTLGNVAWYNGNSGSTTHAVGTKQANELGLYDMSGNVYEWCSDWYDSYGSGAQTNPTGSTSGSYRVDRGGGWDGFARNCRVSYRYYNTPGNAFNDLGLRLALY